MISCPSCKSEKNNLRAPYVYGGTSKHKFYECETCTLIYLYPKLTKEEESIFYAKEFEKFMEKRSGPEFDWTGPEKHIKSNQGNVSRRMKVIDKYLAKGSAVLEIGCSSGFMLKEFKKSTDCIIGIEPSNQFNEFLTKEGFKNYTSLEEMVKANGKLKFDLICHFFVLEHISDTAGFIKSKLEILKDDGVIIAEVPNGNDPLTSVYNIDAFEKFYWSIAHHYYFTPKSLGFILEQIDCEYEFILDQRYDLSNHLTWLEKGVPGGQGRFNNIFSDKTIESYKQDLINSKKCDTFFVLIRKRNK